MTTLLPPAYFGPVGYFADTLRTGNVLLDFHSHFVKQSVRSRTGILGANGPLKLIVPLQKWDNRTLMKNVRLDNSSNWRIRHFRSLRSAYGNSPYFAFYEDRFSKFFDEEHEHLTDLNLASTKLVSDILNLDCQFNATEEFVEPTSDGRIIDLRYNYGRGLGTSNLEFPQYQQVFADRTEFVPNLSILDLIFNLGPAASHYLESLVKKSTEGSSDS